MRNIIIAEGGRVHSFDPRGFVLIQRRLKRTSLQDHILGLEFLKAREGGVILVPINDSSVLGTRMLESRQANLGALLSLFEVVI